jgi:hypothetical protein
MTPPQVAVVLVVDVAARVPLMTPPQVEQVLLLSPHLPLSLLLMFLLLLLLLLLLC